ncbi:unnamed protein product [Brassicogethes aeneus]|uniref:Uncharacterized protein n=1 Tax=Brassicogethes aeneus TaxID=1431903 RepID=A0A9P0BDH8_BRAAE|nr:unnamed protein product [Brassicogethes aeneus]
MPYHEAIYCELEEKGLLNTMEFLKQLITFQETSRKQGADTASANKPRLVNSKNHLDYLVDGLSKAEIAEKKAKKYCFDEAKWEWLGEQLVIQSKAASSRLEGNKLQLKAISEYMHGRFIIETTDSKELGIVHLESCRETSNGKPWKAKAFFPEHKQSLAEEVCLTLYHMYYNEAKELLKTFPKNAGKYALLAKKRAMQACFTEGITESMLLKGITDLVDNNLELAIQSMVAAFGVQMKNEAYDPRLKIAMEKLRSA